MKSVQLWRTTQVTVKKKIPSQLKCPDSNIQWTEVSPIKTLEPYPQTSMWTKPSKNRNVEFILFSSSWGIPVISVIRGGKDITYLHVLTNVDKCAEVFSDGKCCVRRNGRSKEKRCAFRCIHISWDMTNLWACQRDERSSLVVKFSSKVTSCVRRKNKSVSRERLSVTHLSKTCRATSFAPVRSVVEAASQHNSYCSLI